MLPPRSGSSRRGAREALAPPWSHCAAAIAFHAWSRGHPSPSRRMSRRAARSTSSPPPPSLQRLLGCLLLCQAPIRRGHPLNRCAARSVNLLLSCPRRWRGSARVANFGGLLELLPKNTGLVEARLRLATVAARTRVEALEPLAARPAPARVSRVLARRSLRPVPLQGSTGGSTAADMSAAEKFASSKALAASLAAASFKTCC